MLESLGLAGDGDEIDAIHEVEKAFGVVFDQSDADGWWTVDDVFASLCRRLDVPHEDNALWPKFVEVLGQGADLSSHKIGQIGPETRILAPPLAEELRKLWRWVFG